VLLNSLSLFLNTLSAVSLNTLSAVPLNTQRCVLEQSLSVFLKLSAPCP
jgi:hypothetical protein